MNREIKFRGKRAGENTWIYGYLREVFGNDKRTFMIAPAKTFGFDGVTDTEEDYVEADTVSQFTGLYDKNGKDIYEGDILRSVKFHDIVGYVMYDKKEGAFMFIKIDELMKTELETRCHITERWLNEFPKEVIGNIYDNKELLEE